MKQTEVKIPIRDLLRAGQQELKDAAPDGYDEVVLTRDHVVVVCREDDGQRKTTLEEHEVRVQRKTQPDLPFGDGDAIAGKGGGVAFQHAAVNRIFVNHQGAHYNGAQANCLVALADMLNKHPEQVWLTDIATEFLNGGSEVGIMLKGKKCP